MLYNTPQYSPTFIREKHIPEIFEINRLNDCYVKYLLGSESHKDLTIQFLNDILNREGSQSIIDLSFSNKEFSPHVPEGKLNTLDIRCKINDGSQVHVEIQVRRKPFIIERFLYYWAMIYADQLKQGDEYHYLKPVISINLLNFNQLSEENWHNIYQLRNTQTHTALTNHCEIHYLELKKFTFRNLLHLKRAEKWALYFSGNRGNEWRELTMNDKTMNKVQRAEMEFTKDEDLRWQYILQERALHDYNTDIKYAKTEAINKIVLKMLKTNSPYEYISEITDYPIERIKAIAKEHHLAD